MSLFLSQCRINMREGLLRQGELGEVRVPFLKRPVIQVVDPGEKCVAVADAGYALREFRRSRRRKIALQAWRRGNRQGIVLTVAKKLEILNQTPWNSAFVCKTVCGIYEDLALREKVSFWLHDSWIENNPMTDQTIPGTDEREISWDGDAWERPRGYFIRLCVDPASKYPMPWEIDSGMLQECFRKAISFQQPTDTLVYLAAYMLRRLWQLVSAKRTSEICRLLVVDSLIEADIYALRALSFHRAKSCTTMQRESYPP